LEETGVKRIKGKEERAYHLNKEKATSTEEDSILTLRKTGWGKGCCMGCELGEGQFVVVGGGRSNEWLMKQGQ